LVERDGIFHDQVVCIPNAVTPAPARSSSLADLLPLPPGPKVGVIARLQPEKGVEGFVRAAKSILAAYPQASCLILGDGPLRPDLEWLARHLGIAGSLHFLGFRTDARAFLPDLDVLAVPSLTEGGPLVILEAMAAGVPVVASAVGGIPEQVRHNEEGLLVPAGDTLALAEAILSLLQNPQRARVLGEAGRRRSLDRYQYDSMLNRVEEVYRQVLGRELSATNSREKPQVTAGR